MAQIIDLYERIKRESKVPAEKFIQTLEFAYQENVDLLDKFTIELKPSQWIVLTIEPEILEKTVLRAKDLGFLDAYQQNPAFLKQDVDKIIKRMGLLEANSIPYKSENGKYQSFLFSERGFNYVLEQANIKEDTHVEEAPEVNDFELKKLADRIMETFALTNETNDVYAKLSALEKEGMGVKETLMETFKSYCDGNLDYLSSTIDEIVEANKEEMGRVA